MSVKTFQVEGLGPVKVYKRRGSSSLRLSLTSKGDIRVTMPSWATYKSALSFIASKADWIQTQQTKVDTVLLEHNQAIGKAHHLIFIYDPSASKPTSRIKQNSIVITHSELATRSPEVQELAQKACIRALRAEAEKLLPMRLHKLAEKHDFSYKSVGVKQLKSRWGSCNSNQEITLNLFLMQLPWQLIDYVLLHELTHTKHMDHGPSFWRELTQHVPTAKEMRNELRRYQTKVV